MLKKITVFLILLFLPVLAGAEEDKLCQVRLPFEKATIEYSISGVEEGTETLYIKNFGDTTARFHRSVMQVMGIEKVTETIIITEPEWIYTYDLREKTATKTVNPKIYLEEEYLQLNESERGQVRKNSEKLGLGLPNNGMNGEFEANVMTMLGMHCDKTQLMGTTSYTIHDSDIPLKTESNIMGMITLIEATSVKKGYAPEKYFLHPEGITAVIDPEADAVSRSMAQEIIRKLNDPEASENVLFKDSAHQLQPDPEEQQDMEKAIEALKNIFEN